MKFQVFQHSCKQSDSPRGKQAKSTILVVVGSIFVMCPALSWAANKAPTAVVTASPTSGQAPFTTTLDGTKSSDADGTITAYSWKFGDGTSSTSSKPAHTYTSAGTYKASLKVTDNLGASRTTSVTITVTAPPPPDVAVDVPTGVYAVVGGAATVPDSVLENPDVVGVILRDVWGNVETQDGVYDWSYFDAQIQRVTSANKKVSLVINSGGQSTPDWVMKLGVQKFSFVNTNPNQDTYNTTITIPVFWDPILLEKKVSFIQAVGLRYASNPNIVMVDAQCANATTADWNVPSTSADITAWKTLGFTSDKLLTACKHIVDATMTAFPQQAVKMAIGRLAAPLDSYGDPDYVATFLLGHVNSNHPGRFVAQKYSLSAVTTDPTTATSDLGGWQVLYDNKPNVAAQMLWFATDETSCRMNGSVTPCDAYTMLDKAVTTGINYGMRFLEIYQADLDNPELRTVIHRAATTLGTN